MTTINELEPRDILGIFAQLSAIPRGSGNELAVSDWIASAAAERGLEVHQDELHSLLIRKPATPGYENAPTVILHGHIDMVCEKEETSTHDFLQDPLTLLVDGEFITADGTSLGADNGIGVSYILALLQSTDLPHPPLEAVLTAMEEMGKVGGANFDATQLRGTRMIDFNWITDNQILAGCGGDLTLAVELPTHPEPTPDTYVGRRMSVLGLKGGHCEFDIHLERANAIVALSRMLGTLVERYDVRLADVSGGAQNNVIPSDATAVLMVDSKDAEAVDAAIAELADVLKVEYSLADPDFRIDVEPAERSESSNPATITRALARFGMLIPSGVVSWSLAVPGIVESSNNLGTIRTKENAIHLMTTITAGVGSRKHLIADQICALADLVGAKAEVFGLDAPEFPYNPDSVLLRTARETYEKVIGIQPETLVSNCSLELGMFTNRIPGLDTISIGTNLSGLHSPAEKVSHESVARVWPFVKKLMGALSA